MGQQTTDQETATDLIIDERYHLEHRLGRDELVEIWRARDGLLNRNVVLKRLHPQLLGEAVVLEHFQAEAMAVAAISHANVARRYEVEVRSDVAYTTSEYIDGPPLRRLYSADDPLDLTAVAAVGFQAAAGLAAAHACGVVHRNIGPETIIVGADGRARLAHFRMPRIPGVGIEGTPDAVDGGDRCAAPEQRRDETATAAGDVYALGRTLHEAWVGSLDVSLESPDDGPLARTLKALPSVFNDDREEQLRWAILAATASRQKERISAEELRDRLTGISGSRGELVLRPLVASRT